MKNIIEHLQKCGYGVFYRDEMDEPLQLMYLIISRAVCDQADIIIVHPNYIEWHKDDIRIGEWKPEKLIPVRGFSIIVEQIIERDQIVSKLLKLISTENDKTAYKIQPIPE
jgi:hypothetical protein